MTLLDQGMYLSYAKGTETLVELRVGGNTFKFEDGIGPILRMIRIEENIAIEYIAHKVNKSMNFIYQIERNERKASPTLLRALADSYKIPSHYPLLLLIEGILSEEEYFAIKMAQFQKTADERIAMQPVDEPTQRLLGIMSELSLKAKEMVLQIIESALKLNKNK